MTADAKTPSLIEKKIREYKPDINATSLRAYMLTINKLKREFDDDSNDVHILKNANSIIDHIENTYESLNTRKNKYAAIIVALKAFYGDLDKTTMRYKDKVDEFNSAIKSQNISQRKSEKQSQNWITRDELNAFVKKMYNHLPKNVEDYEDYAKVRDWILLRFHSVMPLRNDCADMKIYWDTDYKKITPDANLNYIVLPKSRRGDGILMMNNYKTEKTHGRIEVPINAELTRDLTYYMRFVNEYTEDNYFLGDNNRLPFTRNGLTKLFIRIFKPLNKKISSSMIRHIVITDIYKPKENDLKEKTELARVMGHTIGEAEAVYAKI